MEQDNKKDTALTVSKADDSKPIVLQQQNTVKPYSQEQIELIKNTVAKGATNDELKLFMVVANKTGLDPFTKQIHFVKRKAWNKETGNYTETGTHQVGIDGFRAIADRTGLYAGNDDPMFDREVKPTKATVTVYKLVKGTRCPFTATARWDQYYPGDKQGFMWNKMPHLMLGKCAEALALRKAFPNDLSGLYTNEEMEQADNRVITEVEMPKQVEAKEIEPVKQVLSKLATDYIKEIGEAKTKEEISEIGSQVNTSKKAGQINAFDWENIKPVYMAKLEELTK